MATSWQAPATTLVSDLKQIFGARLHAVAAYGPRLDGADDAPLTCVALVSSLSLPDLEACARIEPEWERRGVATPLILPVEEFTRSLDAFPLEYGEIIRTHVLVFGNDPFVGTTIPQADLRRACETRVKGHLLHLREGFVESGNKPHHVAELVTASAPAFAALLRHVAHLCGAPDANRADTAFAGARAAGVPEGIVREVLSLERPGSLQTTDAAQLFPEYLAAVEQLARTVDTWRE